MNLETLIASEASVENAGGLYYLAFPYTSSIGKTAEHLSVRVPIKGREPSPADKKALLEAVTVQGGMGRWTQKDDGSVWLVPAE